MHTSAALMPNALAEDGTTYRWLFGGRVSTTYLAHLLYEADPGLTDVDITLPVADTILTSVELPYPGAISVTRV